MSGREELTAQERFARRLCQNVCDLTGEPRLLVHGEMSALLEQSGLADLLRRERAAAWDEGYTSGHSNAMRRMSDEPNAPTTPNPHRADGLAGGGE